MLQVNDSRLYISKNIFFNIAEYIVPNFLIPTHPKEILYQDKRLKQYRLVCKVWRDIIDQRINFITMFNLFYDYGWDNEKLINFYKKRLDYLKKLYQKENKWLIDQKKQIEDYCQNVLIRVKKRDLNYQYPLIYRISFRYRVYQKILKLKLLTDRPDIEACLMFKDYLNENRFLYDSKFIRSIVCFYRFYIYRTSAIQIKNILKKMNVSHHFSYVFSRLLNQFVFTGHDYRISCLQQGYTIIYRCFLDHIYKSFVKQVDCYFSNLNDCSKSNPLSIAGFFNFYKNVFISKDFTNKYFLYYLLLYSRDEFFKIQMILLLDFIKGFEKKFTDYPESDRIDFIDLFKKNIMGRMQEIFCETEDFLRGYFGID